MTDEVKKVQDLGTPQGSQVVNASPSEQTVPKVRAATEGAAAGGAAGYIFAKIVIIVLARMGILFDGETERPIIEAGLEFVFTVGGGALTAWWSGYRTKPAGNSAPDVVPAPRVP